MGVQCVIPGWCIDSTGPFQNQESKSILIMQCFKINTIQNQKRHSIYQYQELISILEDWQSKSISKIKIDYKNSRSIFKIKNLKTSSQNQNQYQELPSALFKFKIKINCNFYLFSKSKSRTISRIKIKIQESRFLPISATEIKWGLILK